MLRPPETLDAERSIACFLAITAYKLHIFEIFLGPSRATRGSLKDAGGDALRQLRRDAVCITALIFACSTRAATRHSPNPSSSHSNCLSPRRGVRTQSQVVLLVARARERDDRLKFMNEVTSELYDGDVAMHPRHLCREHESIKGPLASVKELCGKGDKRALWQPR